jgi:hypothetical protein
MAILLFRSGIPVGRVFLDHTRITFERDRVAVEKGFVITRAIGLVKK